MLAWLPNAICFQLVWIASVGGGAHGWWWAGPVALAAFALWQLAASRQPRADVLLIVFAAVLGFGIDTLWVQADLMRFSAPVPFPQAAPVWIVALWMGFALTLNHSLAALKSHLAWATALGVVGGPVAYAIAAHAWHAVELREPAWLAYAALALAWGVLTPLLLQVARRLEAVNSTPGVTR